MRRLVLIGFLGIVQVLNCTAAWLRPSSGGGGSTTANTNAPAIIAGTNVVATTNNAGSQNVSVTINVPSENFINGRTNYIAMFRPNTNTVKESIMFQTNGTTDIAMRNGDNPVGNAALRFIMYGNYATEATKDSLEMNWNVGQNEYEILTQKGASGITRRISFGTGGTLYWNLSAGGSWLPNVNNTVDIGAGSDDVRNLYMGSAIISEFNGSMSAPTMYSTAGTIGYYFSGTTMGFGTTFPSENFRLAMGSGTGANRFVDCGPSFLCFGSACGTSNSFIGATAGRIDGVIQIGTNNTSITALNNTGVAGPDGSGTHAWGGDLKLSAGPSTGSGTNGSLVLYTAEGGAPSTTLNVAKIRTFISAEPVTLTDNTATIVCSISNIVSGNMVNVKVQATTFFTSSAGTNVVGETFTISGANIGGTMQPLVVSASTPMATYNSSGTATTTWTAVVSANGFDIKNTAHTSLTSPTDKTRWRIDIDSDAIPHVYADGNRHL